MNQRREQFVNLFFFLLDYIFTLIKQCSDNTLIIYELPLRDNIQIKFKRFIYLCYYFSRNYSKVKSKSYIIILIAKVVNILRTILKKNISFKKYNKWKNIFYNKIIFLVLPCIVYVVREAQCLICINNICSAFHIFSFLRIINRVFEYHTHYCFQEHLSIYNKFTITFVCNSYLCENIECIRMQFNVDRNLTYHSMH